MGSSPLAAREPRRLWELKSGMAGSGVGSVVLFPAVPAVPAVGGYPLHMCTVLDSVDGDDSDFEGDLVDGGPRSDDPACGRGGRVGGCECSCKAELGHLNRKVRKLEDLLCLLITDTGLAV